MKTSPRMAPTATKSTRNLLETAALAGHYKTFARAIEAAGLGDALGAAGPFTVFAPTDAAFDALPAGKLDSLLKPENKPELVALLNYHVMTGRKTAAEMGKWDSARTVQGQAARLSVVGKQVSIDGARVTNADIDAKNGFLHGIDKVNIPPAAAASN